MIRPAIIAASLAGLTAASVSIAPPASAATVDREQRMCGAALVSAELERDGRQREVDVEVESAPGERWTFVVRDRGGAVLARLAGTTNRDGDWDTWRYLPTRPDAVRITATGPAGTACSLRLSL